jgi:hypothetical protein
MWLRASNPKSWGVKMRKRNPDDILRKKRFGRCRICQNFGKLTKEHVPPASAFNDQSYLQYYVSKIDEAQRVVWASREVNQRGIYLFTLCEKCNNKTGLLYGTDYLKFVQAFTTEATPANAGKKIQITVDDIFPLRVVKQVMSMVLSTSEATSFRRDYEAFRNPFPVPNASVPAGFGSNPASLDLTTIYDELRKFVLNRDATGLPKDVRLYAYAVASEGSAIRTGVAIQGKLNKQKVRWMAVVGLWPVHWVILFHGDDLNDELLELTDWANKTFKRKETTTLTIPCYWVVGKYPLDFRSPQEFEMDHFIGMMRWEGFVPDESANREERFRSAVRFARVKGKWTKEGYLMTDFQSGTYFEAYGRWGWLEGFSHDQARDAVNQMLASVEKGNESK